MATGGQFYWPSVGNYVAAYGQFFMAANTGAITGCRCSWTNHARVAASESPNGNQPKGPHYAFGNRTKRDGNQGAESVYAYTPKIRQALSTAKGQKASDLPKRCARGGTRTRFPALSVLGSGGNMWNPGQSGGCTGQSGREVWTTSTLCFLTVSEVRENRPAPRTDSQNGRTTFQQQHREQEGLMAFLLSDAHEPPTLELQ
jgi:hypothetical protein